MIDFFESSVRINPDSEFFTFVDENGLELTYTYWEARLISAALARRLQESGIQPGDVVTVDLPNSPELVFIMLAAAYAGFAVALLDSRMSDSEKRSCQFEVERANIQPTWRIDEILAHQLLSEVRMLPEDDSQIVRSVYGESRRSRSIMGESQDIIDDTVHFAERAAHLFDREALAVVMFSGGRGQTVAGKPDKLKAVPLTWAKLLEAADATNDALGTGSGRLWQERLPFNSFSTSSSTRGVKAQATFVWQCVLPLGTIGGLQTIVRSVVAKSPFCLHGSADAELILREIEQSHVTHIAVDDMILQDLLTVEEWRGDAVPGIPSRLGRYQCVMLVGRQSNPRTLRRAFDLGVRVFVSYGIPQTSGTIGITLVTPDYHGGIKPMDAYEVRIIDPDEDGYGRLALRGPGIFDGYLNTRTAFTVDHFFITEEKAALIDGSIHIKNRTENMFVSAGQSIYPVEIADVLRHVSGVAGVHVFGVTDERCGMLPVAAIERSDPSLTPKMVEETTRPWFSSVTVPISIFVFDQLPRTKRGRLDRPAIEAIFNS